MRIREYTPADLEAALAVWNEVIGEGRAFAEEEPLDRESGGRFFAGQSYTAVAEAEDGSIGGVYILHPNFPGRLNGVCNASYAVSSALRGRGIGELLVRDCLEKARELGFRVLQFNAVVESNLRARRLYEKLGFVRLGTIPGAFRMPDGRREGICPYYHEL